MKNTLKMGLGVQQCLESVFNCVKEKQAKVAVL